MNQGNPDMQRSRADIAPQSVPVSGAKGKGGGSGAAFKSTKGTGRTEGCCTAKNVMGRN